MRYLRSFFRELSDLREYVIEVHDRSLATVYKNVHSFVVECKYSSVKSAPVIVSLLDGGATTKEISVNLGITESTVRDKIGSISKELYGLFGLDFFKKFKSGNADEVQVCEERLYTAINSCRSSSYYVLDEIKILTGYNPKKTYGGIAFEDCSDEMSFLLKHNKANLVDETKNLSKERINFIISLLDGKGYEEDRYSLFRTLNRGCLS